MNWDYIAGFFDGEGSICCRIVCKKKGESARVHISIGQVARNGEVLSEIQHFLIKEGVENPRLWKRTSKPADMHYLLISNKKGTEEFLKRIYNLVIVKKSKAESALEMLQNWPGLYHTKAFTETEVEYLIKSYESDVPYAVMVETLRCSKSKISEFLKTRGLLRSENHGQFQFRKKSPD